MNGKLKDVKIKGKDVFFERLTREELLDVLKRSDHSFTLTRAELVTILRRDPLFTRLSKEEILKEFGAEKRL